MKPSQQILNKLFSSLETKVNQAKIAEACAELITFLEKYSDFNIDETKNNHGRNLLHHLCFIGDDQLVATLLDHRPKIDINLKSMMIISENEGNTLSPLLITINRGSKGHRAISAMLIKKGAILPAPGSKPAIILLLNAAAFGHEEVVKACIQNKFDLDGCIVEGETALYFAVKDNHPNIVKLLLDANANIDLKHKKDFTPLYIAALKNSIEIVQLLIAKGAMNTPAASGNCALHAAAQNGNTQMIELLIRSKVVADINVRNKIGETALCIAAEFGQTDALSVLLEFGADPELASYDDEPPLPQLVTPLDSQLQIQKDCSMAPLRTAASKGHLEIVKLLIKNKAFINARSNKGITALWAASEQGHSEIVEFLLKQEDIQPFYPLGQTHLWIAACFGHLKTVETILSFDPTLIDYVDDNGNSPLYIAAANGHLAVVELLIKNGANVNLEDQEQKSPLCAACKFNRIEVVKLLLQQKNIKYYSTSSNDFVTPINIAAGTGRIEILNLLITKLKADQLPIAYANPGMLYACNEGKFEVVKYLAQQGCSLDTTDDDGVSVMGYALFNGHKKLAIWLIENGANVNLADNWGKTAFAQACWKGSLAIAKLLQQHGCDCNQQGYDQRSPFHLACEYGHLEVCEWLLTQKVNIHTLSRDSTPLIGACVRSRDAIIKLLLEQNVNVNQQTKISGITALQVACLNSDLALVKKLLANKANINLANHAGESPLYIACERAILAYQVAIDKGDEIKHQVFIRSLLKMGADIQHCNAAGQTVLELALENKCKDLIKLLLDHNPQQTLQAACRDGKLAIVKLCLENNVSIIFKNDNKDLSAIEMATKHGHDEIVNLLIEHDAKNPNEALKFTKEEALKLLYLACCHGKYQVMKLLIEKYRIRASELNKLIEDKTLLYISCENGYVEVVKYLLSQKVDVDKNSTKQKMSPLHIASYTGNTEIVGLLLQAQARTDRTNADGNMPLHLAYEQSQQAVVKQLLAMAGEKHQALLIACRLGQKYLVQQILKADDQNIINKADLKNDCKTALHYICETGNVAIADLLIAAGADVNKTTESGLFPLYIACRSGHLQMVEYLIVNTDVDINEANVEDGETPIALAAKQKNNEDMLGLLMEHGADTSQLKKTETYMSDGKPIPLHSLLLFSSTKRERQKNKAPKRSAEQTEEINRFGDIAYEEVISVAKQSAPHLQNPCTFGNGVLSSSMASVVKAVTHNGHLVPNVYFHIKKNILDKVKASGAPDIFDPLLKDPQMNVFNGLKRLKNIHPDLWELKQQHSPARIYCFRFKSDSNEQDKQGSIIVTIAFSEKGAHTHGEIKAIILSLKNNPEYQMFYGENTFQNSNNSNNNNNKGFF